MEKINEVFSYLQSRLKSPSKLYLVGGASRDYLLGRSFTDFDFACSLSPEDIKASLKDEENVSFAFIRFGIANFTFEGCQITLASFRKEGSYADSRHPGKIEFIKDPYLDSFRRDFTINAIYMDQSLSLYDPQKGKEDLDRKLIRVIGDIPTRLEEDPLRILRALRFANRLSFNLEPALENYIASHSSLIRKLKKEKIREELLKSEPQGRAKIEAYLKDAGIVLE